MEKIKEIKKIINKPYNPEILLSAKDGLSIFDISKKIDLSYTSTFFRIKELEDNNIIDVGKEEGQGNSSKIKISEKYDTIVDMELNYYLSNKKEFEKLPFHIDVFKEFLKQLKNERLVSMEDINLENEENTIRIYDRLYLFERLGFIKTRVDITKKGLNFIKNKNASKIN